ncbi:hypothetical protein HGA64_01050, partial [Candidatus Falkowbacteria bacterium]|nr:hypothetical protein [Candidatus Falkowbacteria bacterium]
MKFQPKKTSNLFLGLFLGLVALAAIGQLYWHLFGVSKQAEAAGIRRGGTLNGYAWSSNFGWISFNCDQPLVASPSNDCATVNYKVKVGLTGQLSGLAWSSNLHWIMFGPDDYGINIANAPDVMGVTKQWATIDMNTGQIYGWAKALAYGASDKGWILFDSAGAHMPGVTVDLPTGDLNGWAWDGDNTKTAGLGWISFNSANE